FTRVIRLWWGPNLQNQSILNTVSGRNHVVKSTLGKNLRLIKNDHRSFSEPTPKTTTTRTNRNLRSVMKIDRLLITGITDSPNMRCNLLTFSQVLHFVKRLIRRVPMVRSPKNLRVPIIHTYSKSNRTHKKRFADLPRNRRSNPANSRRIDPIRAFSKHQPTKAILPTVKADTKRLTQIKNSRPASSFNIFMNR